MTDHDALLTLRKAAKLWEALAASENEKPQPDLKLMAECMTRSADIAKDIAAIEDRRGIAPRPHVDPVEITFVRSVGEKCPKCKTTQSFICTHCGHEETVEDLEERQQQATLLPAPPPDSPSTETRTTDAACQPEPAPKEPPPQRFSRSEVDPHYRGELQADPMCPLSFSPNGDSPNNNWSFNDGSAGSHKPFADPNPVFRNGKFRY